MKKVKLKFKILFSFLFVTVLSLVVSGLFIAVNTKENQKKQIKNRITQVAKVVSYDANLASDLKKKDIGKDSRLERYTLNLQKETGVDFIVILDNNLIRYTHPDKSSIGYKFSSPEDAAKTLKGKIHYSIKKGLLGEGYRIFYPIYNSRRKQIGIICVGMTLKNVNGVILEAQKPILWAFIISFIVSSLVAIFLALYIRRELLDMEPEEISRRVTELSAITESMSDGIIAVDLDNKIVEINKVAKNFFPLLKIGEKISDDFYEISFSDNDIGKDKLGIIFSKEFYISSRLLVSENKQIGRIALFRDRSEYVQLENQLEGTEEYVESLRAQQHEFLNKLQTVSGLIELKQYDSAQEYISSSQHSFYKEFGWINTQIRMPAVAGFIMGKMKEGKEKNIKVLLSNESKINIQVDSNELSSDLIKVLGNLIDNAFDALRNVDNEKKVIIALNYDEESKIIIIEVEDTGQGFLESNKKKMLNTRFSTKGNNRGFGLNIVNQIVVKHEGFIDFMANKPYGTIVYVEIPVKDV